MPVFGMLLLLAGIVLYVFTSLHAPENAPFGGPWSYKPGFYYLFLATAVCFVVYGLYEIVAELRGQGGRKEEGFPKTAVKKCPSCAEYVKEEANICRYCRHEFSGAEDIATAESPLCEACGQPIGGAAAVAGGESRTAPGLDRTAPGPRLAKIPTVIATFLVCAVFFGAGFYAWQALRAGSVRTSGRDKQLEIQKSVSPAEPPQAAKDSSKQAPATPPDQESPGPFRLGSTWAIDWQSKHRYRGVMLIQGQLAPNKYLATLEVTYTTRKKNRQKVWMEALVKVTGRDVVINCRNPNVSWWDTDDFYLKWDNGTLTGYNIDKKGRRGRAVFTLVEEANPT